ncbi:MAG: SAM-dependent methyltransferase [Candidatus Pacebacteria bacterium]|nr:SAM-dependent methyltransferase [Candidatus Paceibacterota bacterium]
MISDAGTPTISDPGVKIISELYEKFNNEINIIPIPGPTALISAISVSGFSSSEFIFYGFLPHKKGREKIFKEIAVNKKTSIFYESPHRLMKSLESLIEFCEENKEIFIARELTKIYEHKIKNKVVDIKKYFKNNPDKIKGEFVVVVKGIK